MLNNEKVYIEGYVVGFMADATGTREKQIQVSSGEIVSIDENFIHKSITPEKVKIPQMVADWIKKCKTFKYFTTGLSFALQPSVWEANGLSGECIEWLTDAENQETFARAWIFGYDVEKEKRYKVVMPNVSSSGGVLTRIKHDDSWIWIDTLGAIVEGRTHTRKELEEAGFGWVFSCEGIEIEEVTG